MKLLNLLILFFLTLSCNGNRNENSKGKLSVDYLIENTQTKIKTADLLEHLSWSQLIQDCELKKGVCEEYKMDSVLTKFSFKRKETKNEISITSYKGEILAFNKTQRDEFHDKEIRYFEKSLWFDYVNEQLPSLPSKFHIDKVESSEILKSYYRLIGLNTRDEYGWICEYSSVGMMTGKRVAVLELVKAQRLDLLRKLLGFPNQQVKLYAADALIYLNYKREEKIKSDLAKFKKFEIGKKDNEILEHWHFGELRKGLMNEEDKELIKKIIASKEVVKTCGNSGSYKFYSELPIELISKKMVPEILENYDHFLNEN